MSRSDSKIDLAKYMPTPVPTMLSMKAVMKPIGAPAYHPM